MNKKFRLMIQPKLARIFTSVYFFLFALIFISWQPLACQDSPELKKTDTARLKIYMDCYDCDYAYFRKNLPYTD